MKMERRCFDCNIVKPITEYTRRGKGYYFTRCDPCRAIYMRPWQGRDKSLLQRYNLTIDSWDAIFEKQGRVCAICRSPDPKHPKGWHTDHDHKTNQVRGILCNPCNTRIAVVEHHYYPNKEQYDAYLTQLKGK